MRILVTAGPTREYIDDVRFLSNASSGKMGYSIAAACRAVGHEVVLITGPVRLTPPQGCEVHAVETTDDLDQACRRLFADCDGIVATAAVCDYRPRERVRGKLTKTGGAVSFEFVETVDVLAALGTQKGPGQWIVGFALESQDPRVNAMRKLKVKNCDYIVVNDTSAIGSEQNAMSVLAPDGTTVLEFQGPKPQVAADLVDWLTARFDR